MSTCPITNQELNEENSKVVFTETGKQMTVHVSVKTHKCSVCGKEHVWEDENNRYLVLDDNERLICRQCQTDKKYEICSYCGKWELKSKTKKVGGYRVCEQCLAENYTTCPDCGSFVAKDEVKETHDGKFVCLSCANKNYKACTGCGKLVKNDEVVMSADNYPYHVDCFESNTRLCSDCGERYSHNMGGRTSTVNGVDLWYCRNCEDKHIDIHNYGYKPTGQFRRTDKDDTTTQEFFGAEIELGNCSNPNRYARQFLNIMNGEKAESNVYLKSDCSIVGGGFECVTKPMTRNYIYDEFASKLVEGMSYLDSVGFKGHNHGGIHIHVSKNAFTDSQVARIVPLVFTRTDDDVDFWLILTQRQKENLLQWGCPQESQLSSGNKDVTARQITSGNINWKNGLANGRRCAMNIQSTAQTVEFRIFNSSTKVDRILERYEVIFSLMDFGKTDIAVSHINYLKFIAQNKKKYSNLYELLVEKSVINEDDKTVTFKDTTVEFDDTENTSEVA